MRINKILKLKNNKYKILFDNDSFITYDNVILSNELLYKKEIDLSLYKKIIDDTSYYDIYDKTVKYILKRMRSRTEVVNYIKKYTNDLDVVNSIVSKLEKINLINDKLYCKSFINDKTYLSSCGISKIKNDLIKQNISEDIIDEQLNDLDKNIFSERLEKIIKKKIETNKKYSNSFLRQKLLNDLINLGYNKIDIMNTIDKYIKNDASILEREYNKLYNRLKLKYDGIEFKNKLIQKLIQKGFNREDIYNLIQKKED